LNNACGFCVATAADLARACDAYLHDHPYDRRDAHEAATGWYSSEVLARALQITGDWKGRFQWGLEPLHVNPAQLESADVVGAVVNLRAERHWVAIHNFENELWLLDSQKAPELLSPVQYKLYVRRHRDAYPIYRAKNSGEEEEPIGPDTCSTTVGLDTLGSVTDTPASAATAGSSAGGSTDTPPATQPSGSQHSPRAAGAEQPAEQGEPKRRRQGDVDDVAEPGCSGRDYCLAPALAVAQISADDAQEMIYSAPLHPLLATHREGLSTGGSP
jgi:hypothetical protein